MQLVIFDCDGTLVDSQHAIHAAMRRAWQLVGVEPLPLAAVRDVIGLSLLRCFEQLHPTLSASDHKRLTAEYRSAFAAAREAGEPNESLYDGCREALDSLRDEGYLLAVATGKSQRGLDAVLEAFDLRELFCCLKTADDGPSKPHPEILEQALAETGVRREDAVMIGDTTFDMLLGRNAGLRTLGVAWGYHDPEELLQSGAESVLSSYGQLPRSVGNLLA